jgi:hypothetical protein
MFSRFTSKPKPADPPKVEPKSIQDELTASIIPIKDTFKNIRGYIQEFLILYKRTLSSTKSRLVDTNTALVRANKILESLKEKATALREKATQLRANATLDQQNAADDKRSLINHIRELQNEGVDPANAAAATAAAAALQRLMLRGRRELPHARESAGAGFGSALAARQKFSE